MKQRILTPTLAAFALVAAYGVASAQPSGLYRNAAAVVIPLAGSDPADQREVISPPSNVDATMSIQPPMMEARMPVLAPPAIPEDRFGIGR